MQRSPNPDSFHSWLPNYESEYGGCSGFQWIDKYALEIHARLFGPGRML